MWDLVKGDPEQVYQIVGSHSRPVNAKPGALGVKSGGHEPMIHC